MPDTDTIPFTVTDIEDMEERLRTAMLDGDVDALDALLDSDLIFVDLQGRKLGKLQDMEAYSSQILKLKKIEIFDRVIKLVDNAAIVSLSARIAGTYYGESFSEKFAYSRVWLFGDGMWRVVLAHCTRITME